MSNQCWCGFSDYVVTTPLDKNPKLDCPSQTVRCKECGLVRTFPSPQEQKKETGYYLDGKDCSYRSNNIGVWLLFANHLLNIIKPYQISGALLDVGTNIGTLVDEALKMGYDAKGIDISQDAIENGKKLFDLKERLFCSNLPEANFINLFDIITYNHVLEHIKYLDIELTAVNKALKPNGIIAIAVPNFNSIWRRVLQNRWRGLALEQHQWQFEQTSLEKIIKKNNFTILKTFKKYSIQYHLSFSPSGLLKIILILFARVFKKGDNLIILARKN